MQIPESKLKTIRGKTIGIGRVKIPKTSDFDYEIPLLSFIIIEKEGNDGYVSSCIHLQIDGYGKTVEDAQFDMLDNILYFMDTNFNGEDDKEHCWENILDLFESNEDTCVLWDKYHAFQIMLAERGHATDRYSQLLKNLANRIEALEDRVTELEKQMNNRESQGQYEGSKFMNTVRATKEMPIVEYIPVQKGVA